MNKSAFQKGLKDGIPIGLGYFAVSFTFGIMAIQAGLSALAGCTDLSDQSDIGRSVCGYRDHCCQAVPSGRWR